jgi:nucleotide-binding universal stress UspA family protein
VRVISVADTVSPWWADTSMVNTPQAVAAYTEAAEPSRTQHEELARDMAQRLQAAGLEAGSQRRDGDPAEQIVNVAKSWQADLIVVGTHGRTGLRRFLMGSVARNVLLHAHCSVLVVRERRAAEDDTPPGIA